MRRCRSYLHKLRAVKSSSRPAIPCAFLEPSSTSPWRRAAWTPAVSFVARIAILRLHSSAASIPCSYEEDERGPFSDKILRLTDEIAGLSDEELVQMSAGLRKALGIPEPSCMAFPPSGAMDMGDLAPQPAEVQEKPVEKTSFNLKLEKFDASQKIKVIKEVRAIANLGLKEAKDLVEKVPAVFKTGVSKEEALQIVEKIKAVGGEVVML